MADLRSILQPILSRRGRHWHAAEVPVGVWKHGVAVPAVAETGLQVWALGASWDLPVMPTTCNCDGATGLHNVTKQLHNGMYLSVRMQSTAAALSTNVESLLSRSEKTYNGTSKPVTTVSLKTASQCLTSSDLRTHKRNMMHVEGCQQQHEAFLVALRIAEPRRIVWSPRTPAKMPGGSTFCRTLDS